MKNKRRLIYQVLAFGVVLLSIISCSKNDTTAILLETGTINDFEGNIYKTVTIGTQTWLAENLKSTRLNDGTLIQLVNDNTGWSNLTTPGYCYYQNDSATYKGKSGALYNWYTIKTNKLCPTGWHVPTDSEWSAMTMFLDVDSIAGGKLKQTGTSNWTYPNTGATNSSGFSALPGGYRYHNGSFYNIAISGNWWTATDYTSTSAWYRYTIYSSSIVGKNFYDKLFGFSVRCLKN